MASSDTIGRIISGQWSSVLKHCNSHQVRHLHAIRSCRTPALGGHIYVCNQCQSKHKRYNSCRNRHCPQCQKTQKYRWIEKQESKLLPCPYFHVVFTVPHLLNSLNLAYPRQLYTILFQSAWETLDEFGWNRKYLGAQLGATLVLHTWGSNLSYHPHVHCIVPGGGLALKGKWKALAAKGKYLFPVKALSKVYRGKYISKLEAFMTSFGMELGGFKQELYEHKWVVYCKPPPSRKCLISYLARYTHQIAITPSRILSYDSKEVVFTYKDYRHGAKQQRMRLSNWEFVRRFAQHILPHGFTRIRHYGILHSSCKHLLCHDLIPPSSTWIEFWANRELQISMCPTCKSGILVEMAVIPPNRGPPTSSFTKASQNQSIKELVS